MVHIAEFTECGITATQNDIRMNVDLIAYAVISNQDDRAGIGRKVYVAYNIKRGKIDSLIPGLR